jgi:hypothetical protein
MLTLHPIRIVVMSAVLGITGCGPALSNDEATVVGQWQLNTFNGAVWRYTFRRNHTVTVALPRNDSVDANRRNAGFVVVQSGTWSVEGRDVVYILKATDSVPARTTRFPLSELTQAVPFGTDINARWQRM